MYPLSPDAGIKKKNYIAVGLLIYNIARVGNVQHGERSFLEYTLRMTSPRNYLVDGKTLIGNSDRIFP